MSIKACPRRPSKKGALDSFVPRSKTNPARRILAEMSNNSPNALISIDGRHSPQSVVLDDWVDFSSYDENTLDQDSYRGNCQNSSLAAHPTSGRTSSYITGNPIHHQQPKTTSIPLAIYQDPAMIIDSFAERNSALSTASFNFGTESFTNVSGVSMFNNNLIETTRSQINAPPFARALPWSISSGSYLESSSANANYAGGVNNIARSVHCHRSKFSLDGPLFGNCDYMPPYNDIQAQHTSRHYNAPMTYNTLPVTHHGLPTMHSSQQYHDHDASANTHVAVFAGEPLSSGGSNPQEISMKVSTSGMSTMEMGYSTEETLKPEAHFNATHNIDVVGVPGPHRVTKSGSSAALRARRKLPDSATNPYESSRVAQNNPFASNRFSKTRISKHPKDTPAHPRATSMLANAEVTSGNCRLTTVSVPQRHATPKRTALKPVKDEDHDWEAPANTPVNAMQCRDRDDLLIKSKRAGMSYREIRRRFGFTEAESTLRGRFRNLTKHKDARVRKPDWKENDIRLLKKAVVMLTTVSGRTPWKQVADYIANNGGSYHFGNSTCAKKWEEI